MQTFKIVLKMIETEYCNGEAVYKKIQNETHNKLVYVRDEITIFSVKKDKTELTEDDLNEVKINIDFKDHEGKRIDKNRLEWVFTDFLCKTGKSYNIEVYCDQKTQDEFLVQMFTDFLVIYGYVARNDARIAL